MTGDKIILNDHFIEFAFKISNFFLNFVKKMNSSCICSVDLLIAIIDSGDQLNLEKNLNYIITIIIIIIVTNDLL